ncbi:MAG: M48 family peptidase [Moraxellaceae bacterium]|nr:MAG: M48 family peptidase [Moraxellaceae bacterium]
MPLSFLKKTAAVPFAFDVVRSARRRSMSIEISKAQVVVRAPYFVARVDIEKFVREKSSWVQQKLAQQEEQLSALPTYSFANGSYLPYLGEQLILVVHRQPKADVVRYGTQLLVILGSRCRLPDEEQTKRLVCQWYQAQALTLLQLKTDAAVARLGVTYAGVTVKATRSKWGHCTAQGAIQYNWQILLAPEPIVDYLVAHEVSHLIHHNHSPAFWAVVAGLCPDYKNRRAWLKAHGMQLMF